MAASNYPQSYPALVITEVNMVENIKQRKRGKVFKCFDDLPSDIKAATTTFLDGCFKSNIEKDLHSPKPRENREE